MIGRRGRLLLGLGAALLLLLLGGSAAVGLYTDALWYGAVGYAGVFWRRIGANLVVQLLGTILAGSIVLANLALVIRRLGTVQLRRRYGNLEIAEQVPRRHLVLLVTVIAILAGWWLAAMQFGGDAGIAALAWLRHPAWGARDPVFGRDIGFFVFTLPLLRRLFDFLLLAVLWSVLLVGIGYALLGMIRWHDRHLIAAYQARVHLISLAAALTLLMAFRIWLGRYEVLLAPGPWVGYTDVRARLPAMTAVAALALAVAIALAYSGWRGRWLPALAAIGAFATGALALQQAYPAVIQKLRVEPNQLASERPYIAWNLDFTRRAYGLADMSRLAYPYAPGSLSAADVTPLLERLPLWDREPLRTNFTQVEAIYNYYRFSDVDLDRYGPQGQERQVAISAREFQPAGLQQALRTWQNLRLNPRYVQGWGAVVTAADEVTDKGEPVYWIENLKPIERSPAAPADVRLTDPTLFFAETMDDYVVIVPGRDSAFTGTPGRDFPAGVRLGSLPRLLAFAWHFGEKNLLFSGELTRNSRIVYKRTLSARLRALARWIVWDSDPIPVLYDGRIVWMVDGYTASGTYPLSRPVDLPDVGRVRYLRGSVKATVDAVTGDVVLYAVDSSDPVLETFRRVFPGLVRPIETMPAELRRHLRYPTELLRTQGRVLEEYHLLRPESFFAGQDVWALANEAGAEGVPRPFEPSYLTLPLPGSSKSEFLLMAPFVARERHNMTALLVARSDPPNYGKLVLLELPRDRQVPGPTQVHALIEQDQTISQNFTLWRQGGSDVDVGHLRIVPVDSSFLYVVPLYLSSRENSIPELKEVAVSDGTDVSMAPTLADAVSALTGGGPPTSTNAGGDTAGAPKAPVVPGWAGQALELMQQAEDRLKAGDWAGYGEVWERLRAFLSRVGPQGSPGTGGA